MHKFKYRDGHLICEGVELAAVANAVGTPAYVYSAGTILARYRRLDAAFAGIPHHICYAVKANSNIAILRLLAEEGAGFDIVSGGELQRVLRAGGVASCVSFAGVGKSRQEIASALEAGVYCFNVESEPEMLRISEVASGMGLIAPVALRVNPDVDAHTHEFISTGKTKNKFGIPFDDVLAIYERASQNKHINIRGVQMHIGSQITTLEPFIEAVKKVAPLAAVLKQRYGIEFFSVGGGIGIAYENALASGDNATAGLDFEAYAEAIYPLLAPLGLKILLEPGRSLVGNAGVLLTTVDYIKKTPTKSFVIVDAAMNDLIRPALYDGQHEIVPLNKAASEERSVVDVVGPICESGDFLAKERLMPPVVAGERLAVMSAGAYGASMSSTYNSRPLLPEVLVEGDTWRTIRKRQTFDEMISLEEYQD